MKNKTIRIGTRGSMLALYQANMVKEAIQNHFPEMKVVIQIIKTQGDKILDVPLAKIGDKGLFTKELENALLNNEIDIAVHSLKDLPTLLPQGIKLSAVIERGEVRDVLITSDNRKLNELTNIDIIGTSSLRRKAQLLHFNPSLKIIDIRGNVETRIKKMNERYCTALILAGAGVIRLKRQEAITEYLNTDIIIPAVSQGIIGIESRENDPFIDSITVLINHTPTWKSALAERAFLRAIEGGCQIPVGCFTIFENDNFKIKGFIADINGKKIIKKEFSGATIDAESISVKLANYLLNQGGEEIMNKIRLTHE